jgi:hypothetical protein
MAKLYPEYANGPKPKGGASQQLQQAEPGSETPPAPPEKKSPAA